MDANQESLIQLQNLFTQRMDVYQSELQDAAPIASIANLSSEFSTFRKFIMTSLQNLQDQVSIIAHQTDNMEMRSRRKILLIHGLSEGKKEDTSAVAVQVVVDKLKISGFSIDDVSRCHRMGHISKDRPRPILLELAVKNKMWYAKKNLKGTGVTLSEFLTKARHDTSMHHVRNSEYPNVGHTNNVIYYLGDNGVRRRAVYLADLDKNAAPDKIAHQQVSKTTMNREPLGAPKGRRAGNASKK